jgi:hypothetical protein
MMSSGGAMRHLMGTPVEAEIRMAPVVEFSIVRQRIYLCRRRALTPDAFHVLHWWLADDRKEENPKASKRDGCEMVIGIRWRVNL